MEIRLELFFFFANGITLLQKKYSVLFNGITTVNCDTECVYVCVCVCVCASH